MTTETKAEYLVADAIREVAIKIERQLQRGSRSYMIDANDLLETLLAIAERLETPTVKAEKRNYKR